MRIRTGKLPSPSLDGIARDMVSFFVRLALDTDVIVAGMRSPGGASAELIRQIRDGRATLLLSVALALEYEAICMLADHRLASGLSEGDVRIFVDGIISMARPVRIHFRWRPQLSDAGDELVLEAAVNGRAQAIVTFNERDFRAVRGRFDVEILRPHQVLRRIVT